MCRYVDLLDDMERLEEMGIEVGLIGETELGFPIPYCFLGKKNEHIVAVVAGTHAREHICRKFVSAMMFDYAANLSQLADGIYFVPMLNIDGVRLCQEGAGFIEAENRRQFLIKVNSG